VGMAFVSTDGKPGWDKIKNEFWGKNYYKLYTKSSHF
jgi:hypothetical protein